MEQLNFFDKLEEIKKPICPVCENSFEKVVHNKKYCSRSCFEKKWSRENRPKLNKKQNKYRRNNTEKFKKYRKTERLNNKETIHRRHKKYRRENKEKLNEKARKRYSVDIEFKLLHNIRTRIRQTIAKNSKRKTRSIELLGCTIIDAREHIEKQFKVGMTWENHGRYGWHIDHIIPCASFDLTDPEQQKRCFHYTNLQPLWAKENMSKGARLL